MDENNARDCEGGGQIDASEPRRYYADKYRAYHENGQLVLFNFLTTGG